MWPKKPRSHFAERTVSRSRGGRGEICILETIPGRATEGPSRQVTAASLAGGRARASLGEQADAVTGRKGGGQRASKRKSRAIRAEGHRPIYSPSGVGQQLANSQLGTQVTHVCLQAQPRLCGGPPIPGPGGGLGS